MIAFAGDPGVELNGVVHVFSRVSFCFVFGGPGGGLGGPGGRILVDHHFCYNVESNYSVRPRGGPGAVSLTGQPDVSFLVLVRMSVFPVTSILCRPVLSPLIKPKACPAIDDISLQVKTIF